MLRRWGAVDVPMPVCPQTWLRSARNFAKTHFRRSPSNKFLPQKNVFDKNFRSRYTCFAFLGQFWRLDRQTDLKIEMLAIFRSRCTYSDACTTEKSQNYVRRRPKVWDLSTLSEHTPPFCFRLLTLRGILWSLWLSKTSIKAC